jgi:DNA-damage-inducible protein D
LTPTAYRQHKGLERENLRDHMTDLELIFSMLGEASTTEIARSRDAQGFAENRQAAQAGGKVAGDARQHLEVETGRTVVTAEKFLPDAKTRRVKGTA